MGTWERRQDCIIEQLKENVSSIVLFGDTGMGKSWTAGEMCERTINEGLCYATLWIYVTENYGINSFYKDIDRQLSLSSDTEEWEYEEKKTTLNLKSDEFVQWGHTAEKAAQVEETAETLKERIQEKLKEIGKTLSLENKYLLLVLDEVGNNLIYNDDKQVKLPQSWISLFLDRFRDHLKIIITTKCLGDSNATQTSKVIEFLPLEMDESLPLLRMRVDKKVSDNQSFQQLAVAIAKKSEGNPAAIFVIAKALNYIAQHNPSELQRAIIKAAYYEKTSQVANPLFYCACDMIKITVKKNCFWHSIYLLNNYGGIHYDELITHWIMEGYFDPFDQIEDAYWKGHGVLMELTNRALLKIQGNNIVTVEGALLKMIGSCPLTTALRLFSVLKDDESLGRVTRMDGMIKTSCNPKFFEKNSTLLIDGSHISREVHQPFFNSMKELKVLAVFKARCESLIPSLAKMDKLLILVLRRCDLGDNVAHINKLRTLKVLEITGDSRLSSLPIKLFDGMTHLQSLNLSGLQIESLPSFSNLRELHSLILRQLSCLKQVQSLKELVKLEVLDLSGAKSLKSMPRNLFDEVTNLQSLNLSGLQIECLPSFSKLHELRELILRRCSRVKKLESLGGLGKLQILDISDATSFESFDDPTLSVLSKIQMIDISSTKIQALPEFGELKELTQIFLSGCRYLRSLPKLQLVTSLQILDLSGAIMFRTFMDQSIAELHQLRILDLSGTSVSKVPYIPRNLLDLNLMGCPELEEPPSTICQEQLRTTDEGWVPSRQLD